MAAEEANERDKHEDDGPITDKVMSLGDHLGELRGRLVKSLAAVLVIFFVALAYANPIIDYLKTPLLAALPDASKALHFTSPLEPFIAQLKVSFLVAVVFGCPIWMFQFWRFVEPALYPGEKRYVVPFACASILLFFSGIAFCFYVMLPFGLDFLIGIGLETAQAIITISDYISVLLILIFAFGFIFETPLILILLAMLDLITADGLADNRKFVAVGIAVLSAVLTPPDPISQIAMAIPTYLMFEASIWIIRLIKKPTSPASED